MSPLPGYKPFPIKASEITPERVYLSRREFLKAASGLGAGAFLAAACVYSGVDPAPVAAGQAVTPTVAGTTSGSPSTVVSEGVTPSSTLLASPFQDELGDPANSYQEVTTFNNYYEFTTDQSSVAAVAAEFQPSPWQVEISGLVNKPTTFGLEDLLKRFPQEERIYRLRCVEAWSMVIPWLGFPLAALLKEVEPLSSARYVRFESLLDTRRMPGQKNILFPWPYEEGLRLDEAMHPLTLLATGLYGKPLPNQNGAPVRLVMPWKYGFKNLKAIVKIELVAEQPSTFWLKALPGEYGFYANVNPNVPHPRWSQANEFRFGETALRPTLMFNGYVEEVAHLYEGMDLNINY